MINWEWLILIFGLGFLLGALIISRSNDSYLLSAGRELWRTPICVRGKFFYVVPEKEYTERSNSCP